MSKKDLDPKFGVSVDDNGNIVKPKSKKDFEEYIREIHKQYGHEVAPTIFRAKDNTDYVINPKK